MKLSHRFTAAAFHLALTITTLVVTSFTFTNNANAAPPVAGFTAEFDLIRDDDIVGQSTISLVEQGNGEWLFSTDSSARLYFMSFTDREQSRLRWLDDKPQPLRFEKQRKRPGKTETVTQTFDWQKALDSGSRGKKSWSTPLLTGTQDLQSHLLALQLDLRAGKRDLHYPVSKHGRVRDYHYQVTKEELQETALGKLPTLRVERIRDADDNRQTITWFAPSLDYIPVRIQQYEDSELQGDMQLRKLSR